MPIFFHTHLLQQLLAQVWAVAIKLVTTIGATRALEGGQLVLRGNIKEVLVIPATND